MADGEAADEGEAAVKTEGWDLSGVFRAQAATLTIAREVKAKAVWLFFTDCFLEEWLIKDWHRSYISIALLRSKINYDHHDPLAISSR